MGSNEEKYGDRHGEALSYENKKISRISGDLSKLLFRDWFIKQVNEILESCTPMPQIMKTIGPDRHMIHD
ncbi:hypothetical protein J23TS9_37660 [Paenibacillus sp. J23TS9]|nr:hypothetical protein J23TS9_37660 [Paenibacillus sp. J23TS9]